MSNVLPDEWCNKIYMVFQHEVWYGMVIKEILTVLFYCIIVVHQAKKSCSIKLNEHLYEPSP